MIEQDSQTSKPAQDGAQAQRVDPANQHARYTAKDVEDALRPHVFDGIQEYDKRLPNWWLFTLYGAIAFAVVYWVVLHRIGREPRPGERVMAELAENRKAAERNSGVLTDDLLWRMSLEAKTIDAGKTTFAGTCASCHMPDLSGQIGPNLKDQGWIHGGLPMEIVATITNGVLAKGMPQWGPVLGRQKIVELTAYILSYHQKGEPIIPVTGWTPGQQPVIAPPAAQ